MSKDNLLYLGHMMDMARKALDLARGVNRSAFDRDEKTRYALVHLLQIIGEAARRVSQDFKTAHPEIPWKDIIGFRHKIVHDYMHINDDFVWAALTTDLEPLIRELEKLLPSEPPIAEPW